MIYTPVTDSGVVCDEYYFRCADGEMCVQETVICDGYNDCPDASDETECKYDILVQPLLLPMTAARSSVCQEVSYSRVLGGPILA